MTHTVYTHETWLPCMILNAGYQRAVKIWSITFNALSSHQVVCQSCSSNKYCLEYLKNQFARVCDQCFLILQQKRSGSGFFPTLFAIWSTKAEISLLVMPRSDYRIFFFCPSWWSRCRLQEILCLGRETSNTTNMTLTRPLTSHRMLSSRPYAIS